MTTTTKEPAPAGSAPAEGFDDPSQKDHEALKERLASTPATREQEEAAIRCHYADPQSRWFPAAMTFLVPASIAKGVQ